MKYDVIIRTQSVGEQRYTVTAQSFVGALDSLGYYLAGPDVKQVLITVQSEVAKVLHLVENDEKD